MTGAGIRGQTGFTLLELIVVLTVIALVAAFGIRYYLDAMDRARAVGVEMLAWRFANTASVIHAWRTIPTDIGEKTHGIDNRGVEWVELEGTVVYLNENGWPANTDKMMSPSIGNQSQRECEQLLSGMFKKNVQKTGVVSSTPGNEYDVSVVGGSTCRYQLAQNKDDPWFFDYSLETGQVSVSVSLPTLKVEQYTGN